MDGVLRNFLTVIMGAVLAACAPEAPPPVVDARPPDGDVYRQAARRFAAVVVSDRDDVDEWLGRQFDRREGPGESDGGTAVPVTGDGYFLTADHVLSTAEGRRIFIVLRREGRLRAFPARPVSRSRNDDIALLHIDEPTPHHYEWTPRDQWLPQGTPVMHAGISTGFRDSSGKLISPVAPESAFSGNQRFKHDIPLEPGDSGGPVVDANGRLIGVNSAVEFLVPLETAFFIESEANRPHIGDLMERIEADRNRRAPAAASPW